MEKMRLGNLIDEVVCKWSFDNSWKACGDSHTFQCDLSNHTKKENSIAPSIINDKAVWVCRLTTNGGVSWNTADMSIPKWLFEYYMKYKTNKISASQIEYKIH
jgi:hypothetical protein